MSENILNNDIATEVKNNLIGFYQLHQEVCDKKYFDAINRNKLHIYKEIKDSNLINSLFIKTEIVILTANFFEKNILHLNAVNDKKQKIMHHIINSCNNPQRPLNINVYFFEIGNFQILHMEAKQTGSYSMGGSADLVRFIMRNDYCFPSAIISYGICFGNDYYRQKLGDTIIANKLYPYFMSAKIEEKYFFVKDSNIFDIDTQLDAKIQYLIGRGELSESDRIFYGNMVTGEAVISNEIMKDIFINAATNQPILGGEMEGYGLFKECQGFECSVPCLLVKSICDWGAYKNIEEETDSNNHLKDKLQAYAAEQAYKVLSILLQRNSLFFELSVYEQVKQLIYSISKKEGEIFNRALLEKILKDDIKISKKDKKIDLLCKIILDELLKENIIENINGGVYRLKGGR